MGKRIFPRQASSSPLRDTKTGTGLKPAPEIFIIEQTHSRQNVVFSIGMKVAFMILGVIGVLPLYLAVFADVGVMLLAVGNSFRVRKIS